MCCAHSRWRGCPEGEGLHQLDVVAVVAGDPREAHPPHLRQLRRGEGGGAGGGVVPEPVPGQQPLELVAHHAAEGGAEQRASRRGLGDAADEEVHVVHVFVDELQPGLELQTKDCKGFTITPTILFSTFTFKDTIIYTMPNGC